MEGVRLLTSGHQVSGRRRWTTDVGDADELVIVSGHVVCLRGPTATPSKTQIASAKY